MKQRDINLYHATKLNSEFLPQDFFILRKNTKTVVTGNKLSAMSNLSREQESECIYSNPNFPLREHKKKKFDYKYNSLVSINKKKINDYLQREKYEDFFRLFNIYITSLFNGEKKDAVKSLYLNQQITDSVYLYGMKCFELIENNLKLYCYLKGRNPDNFLDTTENFYQIKASQNKNINNDCLLLISKFQLLLGIIDCNVFKEEIKILNEIYQQWEQKKNK